MILKDNFFNVDTILYKDEPTTSPEGNLKLWQVYRIRLNAAHPVYAVHFPCNPITPGVCILQIVKELAEEMLSKRLFLRTATNVKFLNVLNPLVHPEAEVDLTVGETADGYKTTALVQANSNIFSKISMLLTLI